MGLPLRPRPPLMRLAAADAVGETGPAPRGRAERDVLNEQAQESSTATMSTVPGRAAAVLIQALRAGAIGDSNAIAELERSRESLDAVK